MFEWLKNGRPICLLSLCFFSNQSQSRQPEKTQSGSRIQSGKDVFQVSLTQYKFKCPLFQLSSKVYADICCMSLLKKKIRIWTFFQLTHQQYTQIKYPDNILITSLATRSSSTTLLKVNYSAIKMEFIEFCEAQEFHEVNKSCQVSSRGLNESQRYF